MVYVQNSNGQPLMPTMRHGKVRRLLKEGKAKVVKRCPFTIRLLYVGVQGAFLSYLQAIPVEVGVSCAI